MGAVTGSGVTLTNEIDDLPGILQKLKDNNTNLIKAKDVRDSIYTLWLKTEENALNTSTTYQNPNPVPISVGGISAGTTYVNPTNMQQMWDELLHPYVALNSSLSLSGSNIREFGNPNGLGTDSLTLNWVVDKKTQDIVSIQVDGETITPTGNDQSGTKLTTGNHSSTINTPQTQNTFSMTSSDGTSTSNKSTKLTWRNRIYWGKLDLSSVNNPNLSTTTGQSFIPAISGIVTSNIILNLNGAGVGSGNKLSNEIDNTLDGINGAGKYLIFAFPSYLPDAKTPTFTVNGLPNSAFTRVQEDWNFTNQYRFVTEYDVWLSNTPQNSPITSFKIS